MNTTAFGVLFFGGLFGLLLGSIWKKESKAGFKALATAVALLFSGTTLAFINGIDEERWMYPVGLVVGFVWSKFGPLFGHLFKTERTATRQGKGAILVILVAVTVGTLGAAALALTMDEHKTSAPEDLARGDVKPVVMPCRLAWIFLERYSNARQQYVTPPAFRYSDQSSMRGPIPSVGDLIVITKKRNLVVTGYGSAVPNKKCNRMLEPPHDYRPDTASDFIAGSVDPGQKFLLNDLSFLPTREADPAYVWASVRVP